MVTKAQLNQLFKSQISEVTYYEDESGDMYVEGKRSRVSFFESSGLIDVFFGPDVHGKSLKRFADEMSKFEGVLFQWDGEAAFQTRDPRAVTDNLKFLGIRRKRKVTAIMKERGKQLAAMNQTTAS